MVPAQEVDIADPAITHWLVPKFLDVLKEQRGLSYTVLSDKDKLRAIVVEGPLDESRIKDLVGASRWVFERARERTQDEPQG